MFLNIKKEGMKFNMKKICIMLILVLCLPLFTPIVQAANLNNEIERHNQINENTTQNNQATSNNTENEIMENNNTVNNTNNSNHSNNETENNTTEQNQTTNNTTKEEPENEQESENKQDKTEPKEESEKKIMSVSSQGQVIENGIYQIHSLANPNFVLDIDGGSHESGANLQIWTQSQVDQQKFEITYGIDGYYTIKAIHSQKVLDVAGNGIANGTNVWQYEGNQTDAQKWVIQKTANGYSFIAKTSGLYLDIDGGITENGRNVQLYEGNSSLAQQFRLEKEGTLTGSKVVPEGIYTIHTSLNQSLVLDTDSASLALGANIQIWQDTNSRQQRVRLTYHQEGYYTIALLHSGKVLEVAGGNSLPGTNVWQWEENGTDAQKWVIEQAENNQMQIRSALTGLYLDISGGIAQNGSNVQVYSGNKSQAQKFILEKEGTEVIADGIYKISSKLNANRYLDIDGGSLANGANAQMWINEPVAQQRFQLTYQGEGTYEIKAVHSNRVLEVSGGKMEVGSNVAQYQANHTDAQKWMIQDSGDGSFTITSYLNLLSLDISGGKDEDGANLQVYTPNGSIAQHFVLKELEEAEGKQTIEDGIYQIATKVNPNFVIDIDSASSKNGANAQLWKNDNVRQQRFQFTYQGNGYYTIQALHSGKVLEAQSGGMTSGTNVSQYTSNKSYSQLWIIQKNAQGNYTFICKVNGLALDVLGGIAKNGTNIQLYEKNNSEAQSFELQTPPALTNGTYTISTSLNAQLVWDISGGSKEEKANLQLWTKENVDQQLFQFTYQGNGNYTIQALHSGLYLTGNNRNVEQDSKNNNKAQIWHLEQTKDGFYTLTDIYTGLCIDVEGGIATKERNIQLYEKNNSTAQKFTITEFVNEGIDVSQFNGLINWEYVKRAGIDFAMIRIGYRGYGKEGNFAKDTRFEQNLKGAKQAGLKVGVYFVTQAINQDEAKEEANWVLAELRKIGYENKLDLPIVIDTELSGAPNNTGRADNLDVETRSLVCQTFAEKIEENGHIPMIYASTYWLETRLNMSKLNQFDIWVAQYNNKPTYTGHYEMWQYTNKGNVLGIQGNVDRNISYKRY